METDNTTDEALSVRTRSRNPFTTVTTSGLLLPIDLLARIVDGDVDGLQPKDYHLRSGERLNEASARAWNECLAAWKTFRRRFAALPASDAGTTVTRDEWLLPLFQELGYGRLQTKRAITIEDREYPVSHGWENHVPIHLLSARYPLDRRSPGVSGAATRSPYSLLQELLNRSAAHRWGFVSNGLKLYLLRDNAALARAANVEFDLEAMLDGEVYSDFQLLFLLCHQSRVEIQSRLAGGKATTGKRGRAKVVSDQGASEASESRPENCWLEVWANTADQQGTRAREKLRNGVEAAINALGAGFLASGLNSQLREDLSTGTLPTQDYYRQLLRLVYRLLLLLVAEEKQTETGDNLLHPPGTPAAVRERYARFYSVGRLRALADRRRGTAHVDLHESLKVLFTQLREGCPSLGIPGLGSLLFSDRSTPDLDVARLANRDLLDAVRQLCFTEDTSGRGGAIRRPVDFGNLGSEELGSVYESLLELHPRIDTDEGPFTLDTAAGHERKTTGSYYTPRSLINCLLDSALEPVVREAIDVPDQQEAIQRLLDLKICDPACGSGHFLIAAAERMAMHLARLRSGDDEPATLDVQQAKREIIGRCVYGVDVNPMAVELCKVSLWMEALEPGRPLGFLDHHIQCGNSLLGTTPRLLAEGIPDDAFKPIEGDDKEFCRELKKDNRSQRKDHESGQRSLAYEKPIAMSHLGAIMIAINDAPAETLEQIAEKEDRTKRLQESDTWRDAQCWADYWCCAFVWRKDGSDLAKHCPMERDFRRVEVEGQRCLLPHVAEEVQRLRKRYGLFHWHLAFPDVFRVPRESEDPDNQECGWNGGFSVVLGNPPWERIKLQDKEWFAGREPRVANARNAAERRSLIRLLRSEQPDLLGDYQDAKRRADAEGHFVRDTDTFPLCGRGDVNTYALFAELNRRLIDLTGRVGCVVPSGIATDATTQLFFQQLMQSETLVSLYSFFEIRKHFLDTDSRSPFCLLTLTGAFRPAANGATFVFQVHALAEILDPRRQFRLTAQDLQLLKPNTRTCPLFIDSRDAELNKYISSNVPVLVREGADEGNPWGAHYIRLVDYSDYADELKTADDCRTDGFIPDGADWICNEVRRVPVYESKLIAGFDSRFATYSDSGAVTEIPVEAKQSPFAATAPRYWVAQTFFDGLLAKYKYEKPFFVVYRDIVRATDTRTMISTVIPHVPASRKLPVLGFRDELPGALLSTNFNSFVLDYTARQNVGGISMSFFIVKQLPIIHPSAYDARTPWAPSSVLTHWLLARTVELANTAWDLEAFAIDCGYEGPPFKWDEDRRFELRCELDAAYFHLYLGTDDEWRESGSPELLDAFPAPRDAVDYIMDTFPIVRRRDEQAHGEYRTKNRILAIYDAMAEAIRSGEPYQTELDPSPGPPAEWYDAAQEKHIAPPWNAAEWPDHVHRPRESAVTSARTKDQASKVMVIQLLLRRWNARIQRDALECGLLLSLNESIRNRVLRQDRTDGVTAGVVSNRIATGMDRILGGMEKQGLIHVEDTESAQWITLGTPKGIGSSLASQWEPHVEEAVRAVEVVKAHREGVESYDLSPFVTEVEFEAVTASF